jgi:heme/copper-type cytochrome/quinol oxidase subunit 2
VLIAITGAIFVLVEGALILFIVRFRKRGRSARRRDRRSTARRGSS